MPTGDPTTSIEFREIPESPGYRFGSDGSVWSSWKQGANAPVFPWRRLSPILNPSGHIYAVIKIDGRRRSIGVHRLICWAFHGPCPDGMECCHRNGDPADNVPENLYWGTRRDNVEDQMNHGVFARGERAGHATFTEDEVREIRRLYDGGMSAGQIASLKGRSRDTIKSIARRVSWKHVS